MEFIVGNKKEGHGVNLKSESEMRLAKFFIFLIFNSLNYKK